MKAYFTPNVDLIALNISDVILSSPVSELFNAPEDNGGLGTPTAGTSLWEG